MPVGVYDGDSAYIKGGTDDTNIGNVSDRLKVESAKVAVPQTKIMYKMVHLTQGASTTNMNVNGSSVNVNYDFTPGSGETWYLDCMRIYLFDTGSTTHTAFGAIGGGLANGLDILIRSNGTEYELMKLKDNADIIKSFSNYPVIPPTSGFMEASDCYLGSMCFPYPITLQNSTSDYVRAKVRDNLTALDFLEILAMVWRTI